MNASQNFSKNVANFLPTSRSQNINMTRNTRSRSLSRSTRHTSSAPSTIKSPLPPPTRKRKQNVFQKRQKLYERRCKKLFASMADNSNNQNRVSHSSWNQVQVQQLYNAVRLTKLNPSSSQNYWYHISKKVDEKSADECLHFYTLVNSGRTSAAPRPKKSSDSPKSIQDITNQLNQQKSKTQTLTKKRLYRDLLHAVDSKHRDDIFVTHHKQDENQAPAEQVSKDQHQFQTPSQRQRTKTKSLDSSFSFLDDSESESSPGTRGNHASSSSPFPSTVTPLKLTQRNSSYSPLDAPSYISPAVIRSVSMQHVDTLNNKWSRQQRQQATEEFSFSKVKALKKQIKDEGKKGASKPKLYEKCDFLARDGASNQEADIDSDEEVEEYFSGDEQ